MQEVGGKVEELLQRTILWCSIAEKIFWSDILQENIWQISIFD